MLNRSGHRSQAIAHSEDLMVFSLEMQGDEVDNVAFVVNQ